jgi:cytochrome b subunit of formate dehydrogenase
MMFYMVWMISLVCDGLMIYAVQCMVKHSFWQVVVFDSSLLISGIAMFVVLCYGFKSLRLVRLNRG